MTNLTLRDPAYLGSLPNQSFGVATLDLRFAANLSLIDSASGQNLITFARSSPATFVNNSGSIENAAANSPRFGHDPITGGSLGLLVEQARANVQPFSELLTEASWINANVIISPSGTALNNTPAWLITENTVTAAHSLVGNGGTAANSTSVTAGTVYTGSAFLKKITVDWVQLTFGAAGFGTSSFANFNIANGTIGIVSGCVARIAPYKDREYRCSITATASTTALSNNIIINGIANQNSSTRGPSYAGSSGRSFLASLPQFEAGNHASSYIPSSNTATTRSADNVSIQNPNSGLWFNPASFTIVADVIGASMSPTTSNSGTGNPYVFSLHQSTNNRLVGLRSAGSSNGAWGAFFRFSGTEAISFSANANFNTTRRHKVGAVYTSTEYRPFANGVVGTTPLTPTVTPLNFTALTIGSGIDGGYWNGTIARLTFWPQRLPDFYLQAIST
jgi:hypothetical protein